MAGANTVYGAGMLELGMSFNNEQFIIDCEIIKMIKKLMQGVPINDETLSINQIKKIGIGNNFLALKETRELIDYPSSSYIFDRSMHGDWLSSGGKDAISRAHEVVTDVLKNHEVASIDKDLYDDMKAMVDKADKEFKL